MAMRRTPAAPMRTVSPSFTTEVHWGPVAWRPMPVPSRPQQTGLWGEAILSQVPARVDGIQRFCGVSAMNPRWTVPGPSDVPIWLRTQFPVNTAGAQRHGASPPYGQGPIAVRQMRRRVAQAALAQGAPGAQAWVDQIRAWS